MKRIKRRSCAALVVMLCLLAGMGVYVWRFAHNGSDWATFSANETVYQQGRLIAGTLTDRSGVILAGCQDGARTFADDAAVRSACLHLVGDREGNIGTGAILQFAQRLTGYDTVTGMTPGGETLALSVDAQLCVAAQEALAGRKGAVMVLNYVTGEVLCMTSSPTYDPDEGFDLSDARYEGVFLNRCISAAYTPGSVFKLVTVAAAIDNLPDLDQRRFVCTGQVTVDGNVVHCTGVHGEQTIEQALANSCNCAFAQLSLELGSETLERYTAYKGLTGACRLSGIPCYQGSYTAYPDGSAGLAWSGIGQAEDLICPYAMLRYVSAVANGGVLVEPTLFAGEGGGASTRLLTRETADKLKQMMSYNVAYAYGAWNFPGLTLCAKSGTAEVGGDAASHAWFTGFLDDAETPYAFVVVVENGGGGLAQAGPVANAVLQASVEKQRNGAN